MSVRPGDTILKDPDAILIYEFNWATYLGEATIDTSTFLIDGPNELLTQSDDDEADGVTQVTLTGGTVGKKYTLTNRITTSTGETDDRSIVVAIRER